MFRTRECQVAEEDACDGVTNITISCNTQPCPGESSSRQTDWMKFETKEL
jgi:hypothetical protein